MQYGDMGFTDKNLSQKEGLAWSAAGFMAMIVGLFVFVNNPHGVVVCLVGISAVLVGYYQWSPFKAIGLG
jgi:hypothetical protein